MRQPSGMVATVTRAAAHQKGPCRCLLPLLLECSLVQLASSMIARHSRCMLSSEDAISIELLNDKILMSAGCVI